MITYQWYLNDVIIGGATNSTLLIDPITEEDFGVYTVAVTSDGNTVIFQAGILSIANIVIEQTSDFKVLTPLSKIDRVSRQCDPTTIRALPGQWGQIFTDGSVVNLALQSQGNKNHILFGSRSSTNRYEANDTKVGRITTLESMGMRYTVGPVGYDGPIDLGDFCVVSTNSVSIGKLVSVNHTPETGGYEIVARAEQIDGDKITFRTVNPEDITLT